MSNLQKLWTKQILGFSESLNRNKLLSTMKPDLIFCAGKNPTFAEIAISAGFRYGAQLPCTTYGPVYFADQNWKNPNRDAYMTALSKHRPTMASVMDWEQPEQLEDVLSWAKSAALFVDVVMIIPKVSGKISSLPRRIEGKEIRLGYSVPTGHGGTMLHVAEFTDWPVHLLGGSPGAQMKLARYMDVKSADGNMAMKMANRGLFWKPGKHMFSNAWVSLKETDGQRWNGDGNYEAFRRSCVNIMAAWNAQ
jgi:hypothetical protein